MALPLASVRDVVDKLRERFSLAGVLARILDGTDFERFGVSCCIKFSSLVDDECCLCSFTHANHHSKLLYYFIKSISNM